MKVPVGIFPPNIGLLSEFTIMVLNDNPFQNSSVPYAIGNFPKLTIVNPSCSKFAGITPEEIDDLKLVTNTKL
jgi:hypothetical protein